MRNLYKYLLVFVIKIISLLENTIANEVLGCGGFIKSHADIDFSKVEIKLLTKQGSLKDKTDCSPSNGYYFLPIYDKGDYLLSIAPPPGWSFEPEQVELTFDGKTDACSQGKDVNFVFRGFGITGKVALAGYNGNGARGVKVELSSEDSKDTRSTTTDINGIFSFTPIIPGKYILRATHEAWHFSKAQHTVVVVSGNTELPENSLIVSGFDVKGRFDASGQLTTVVGVTLFRMKNNNLPMKCNGGGPVSQLSFKSNDYKSDSVCYASLSTDGTYTFKGVAPGKYIVQSVVTDKNLKLHIDPSFIEFEVGKNTLELKQEFKVTGFSVTGKILKSVGGAPLPSAIIKINQQRVTVSAEDGTYTLDNLQAGTYTVQVESPKLQFEEQQVKLEITNAILPTIVPSSFEVCGKIVTKHKSYVIGITKHGSTFHTTTSSKAETGEWCVFLPSGKYNIEVVTSDEERSKGVQFFPIQQQIEIKTEPMNGIIFSQLRATLSGELKCLPDAPESCTAAAVTLHTLDVSGKPTGQTKMSIATNGKYSFNDILPGPYELTVPQASLCFDSTSVFINIAKATESAPPFVQRGYEVTIIASHRAIMKYAHKQIVSAAPSPGQSQTISTSSPQYETFKLLAGVNTFCVPKHGDYKIKLEGCHIYDDDIVPKTFTTSESSPILITAIAHKVGVRVLSTEPNNDAIKLLVESPKLGKQEITPISEAHKVDNKYAFRFDTHLRPDEVLHIVPQSETLLFTPQEHWIVGGHDCIDIAFNFIATRGLILQGKVVPPIKDAKVTLKFPENSETKAQSIMTSVTGEFRFGPIDGSLKFELQAEKESYVFSPFDHQTSSFNAHKLCEIVVKVKDDAGKDLNGVLLSLSGAESYRKNLITSDNGAINFHSLSPSQYFLRPMMKEYKFEPNSKIIDIQDGETIEVELIGRRVAYSVFGRITSLNGEPFGQINVEATADEQCMHHQEEATSENNGQYRLRGLQPGCNYVIRLKDIGRPNSNVARSIPSVRNINVGSTDLRGVNLIAISPVNIVDVTARITATLNEHYKTLRIVLYRKGAPDAPIFTQRVESPLNPKARYNPGIMVFFPHIPLDGKTYVVELRSTLSDHTYVYKLPYEEFVANTSSIFVELDFRPEVRTGESEINQSSISALVLVALVAIAFFKQDLAMDFVNFVWSNVNAMAQDFSQRQQRYSSNKKDLRRNEPLSQKEIEQMAEQINATKKKKSKKVS